MECPIPEPLLLAERVLVMKFPATVKLLPFLHVVACLVVCRVIVTAASLHLLMLLEPLGITELIWVVNLPAAEGRMTLFVYAVVVGMVCLVVPAAAG